MCSALTKQGVDKLLEMILLQADLLELKANPNRRAKGNVIESGLEPGGPTATVLVRKGTLRVGDVIICGQYYGKVRALINEEGKRLKEAGPSVAVKILGLNGVPEAGLEFSVVRETRRPPAIWPSERAQEARAHGPGSQRSKVTLENLFATLDSTSRQDAQGRRQGRHPGLGRGHRRGAQEDRVRQGLARSHPQRRRHDHRIRRRAGLRVRTAIILGFHTRVDSGVADKAKHEGVQIKLYAIIYELIDQVKEAMAGLLDPVAQGSHRRRGRSAQGLRACPRACRSPAAMVTSGRIVRGKVRVRRRKEVIYEGVTQSLRRFQDEVNEVRAGMECGIRIEGFSEFQVGDVIECYTIEKVAQKL